MGWAGLVFCVCCQVGPESDSIPVPATTSIPITRPVFGQRDFLVRGSASADVAAQIELRCRGLRARLAGDWLGLPVDKTWSPPCEIHVHPTRAAYLRVVGSGGSQTYASAMTRSREGRIVERRIDLCVDRLDLALAALPHETVHLILADHFPKAAPPRWLDEGLAVLADTTDKQSRHRDDLHQQLRRGGPFSLERLVTLPDYPAREQVPLFYAQSASLVEFLVAREGPAELLRFVQVAEEAGYRAALSEVYGLADFAALQAEWRATREP